MHRDRERLLTDLDALAGKRVAWVDRDSCAGYLFPKLELLERGRPPDSLFVGQCFLESHIRVVRAVRDGEAELRARAERTRAEWNAVRAPMRSPSHLRAL